MKEQLEYPFVQLQFSSRALSPQTLHSDDDKNCAIRRGKIFSAKAHLKSDVDAVTSSIILLLAWQIRKQQINNYQPQTVCNKKQFVCLRPSGCLFTEQPALL